MKRIMFIVVSFLIMISAAGGEDDPVTKLRDDAMSYFKPVTGVVKGVEGGKVIISLGGRDLVRPGMRLKVLREGEPFIHPVTKELVGKVESVVGKVEIKDVLNETSWGVMIEGEARQEDRVRLSEMKIRMLFCQDKGVDWYLADELYRKLKDTGRIEMIDTALETGEEAKALEEAARHGADVALVMTADKTAFIRVRLFWVSDGSKFSDMETGFGSDYVRDLGFEKEFFTPGTDEAIMTFDLPFGARLMTAGDVDGDGKQEIILSTGKDIYIYSPAGDLKLLWEIKGPASDSHIWIDSVDPDGNGKDEIIVTSMRSEEVVSSVYEYTGSGFKRVWDGRYFLRKTGSGLVAQAYSSAEGFTGDIFNMTYNEGYRLGEKVRVPKGVNIYDYVFIEGMDKGTLVAAYDDRGFMNVYDKEGARLWRSGSGAGGFMNTFKKRSPAIYVEGGEWSVKDRLISGQRDIMVIQRIPFAEMTRGLGYKSSRIRNYRWNGFSMEEGVLIDGIKGTLLDYALFGDKIAVLTSPFLGLKLDKILKGENPLGVVLYIYSVKGRK